MNKILALIVSAAAISTVALATEPVKPTKPQMNFGGGKWSIRVFYGMPTGDIKDDGEVDSVFGGGLDYTLPNMGQSTGGSFSLGVEYSTSSEGVAGFQVQNYGIYAGFAFPLGQNTGMGGLEAIVRAGYFNTKFENDLMDDNRWGFGWDLGLRYKVQKFWLELFYRQRPSLDGVDNNAIAIGVNFPIGN
ncbi:MAG: outer membrane beta-barrel protein [Chlorobia bacterium]|nr:outer membrane beta-barrel protein [Fimbriimonadaceae bacterium]